MPRISVITVVRNGAATLERTIESVLQQKKRVDLDYIIIDGGSTDGTVGIIRRYADRIAYWVSEPDRGVYHAMNKGWAAAASDSLILFLGAGDRIVSLPESIDHFSPREVVYGTVWMGEDRVFRSRGDFHLKLYNSLHHQALLVNKSLHPAPPFDTCYRIYADFDFNQRLKKMGMDFVAAPRFLSYAHPGGLSDARDFRESLRVIEKNYGVFWVTVAVAGSIAMRLFSFLRFLGPVREHERG